jgi:hypothetical protein
VGADAREREEDAITLCASLLSHAEREGWEVSLRVAGMPPESASGPASSAFRRGAWHLERLYSMLAAIDLDGSREGAAGVTRGAGRTQGSHNAEPDSVRGAVTIVVHPARAELAVGGPGAMHLTALHLAEMRQP